MALAAYRHLFRATKIAFAGDQHLLHASREQIRQGFTDNRSLESGSPLLAKAIEHAEGVAEVLRTNIVQGQLGQGQGEEAYSELLVSPGGGGRCTNYDPELNIHKDTERGDNDTVKNPRGKGGVVKVDTGGC